MTDLPVPPGPGDRPQPRSDVADGAAEPVADGAAGDSPVAPAAVPGSDTEPQPAAPPWWSTPGQAPPSADPALQQPVTGTPAAVVGASGARPGLRARVAAATARPRTRVGIAVTAALLVGAGAGAGIAMAASDHEGRGSTGTSHTERDDRGGSSGRDAGTDADGRQHDGRPDRQRG